VALAIGAGVLLTSCIDHPVVTESGTQVKSLYTIVLVIATVVFVGVEAAIVYNAIRYRRRRDDDTLPEQHHGNVKIEIVWTLIPSLIVLALFVMSMVVLADVNKVEDNDPLTVRITGYQWQWKFEYFTGDYSGDGSDLKPLGVTVQAESQTDRPLLRLPVGERIHFQLETLDVIHSFYVPDWLFKRDLVPGLHNTFDTTLKPEFAGDTFEGQCAELCGDNHNEMQFQVQALDQQQFESWIDAEAKKQAQGGQCSPTGTEVTIAAVPTIKFDTDCLAVPANQPFTIEFDNKDEDGIPHNVAVYTKDPAAGGELLGGATDINDTVTAPDSTTYEVDALDPGNYYFQCDVHTGMNGDFVVK
jgi:cytochrome c oxidase subunit 2